MSNDSKTNLTIDPNAKVQVSIPVLWKWLENDLKIVDHNCEEGIGDVGDATGDTRQTENACNDLGDLVLTIAKMKQMGALTIDLTYSNMKQLSCWYNSYHPGLVFHP